MKNLNNDMKDFYKTQSSAKAPFLSAKLKETLKVDLNPSVSTVFTKLAGLHLIAATITLTLCPQFGVRLFAKGMGLMHVFMSLGPVGCLVACGSLFIGASFLLAGTVLKGEELRLIRNHRFLTLTTLTSFSLGFFIMLSAEVVLHLSIAWFIGALVGGSAMLEFAWALRFKRVRGRAN